MLLTRALDIRIPAAYVDAVGTPRFAHARFKLGLGPCGKVAARLYFSETPIYAIVTQVTDCGETKTFRYRHGDIRGRIEITEFNS